MEKSYLLLVEIASGQRRIRGSGPPGKSQVIWVSIGYKQLDPPGKSGSELTRKGVCEQAEHVMSPHGKRRMMKTRTNQPMQKYRCSYKAFKWRKHSQKRKLWVFLQNEGREMYYSES